MEDMLDIYDERGCCIGVAPRRLCHGDPSLLHRTAHVVVIHPETGALLLQKRSKNKDIQPGKWDSAVGGHLAPGESYETGALRELQEELGVRGKVELVRLFDTAIRNDIESEDVRIFGTKLAGPFAFQSSEIDEVRFWTREELSDPSAQREFTPNLLQELKKLETISNWYPDN